MSVLPDAIVIGSMKAGTTWIHEYFAARGDVALPRKEKETFFFDRYYAKGVNWYATHFDGYDDSTCRFALEVAPSYFHCPEAPARVRSILGDLPLIVTLRDPVRRAWSHYMHLRRYGRTNASLRDAVEQFPEIIEASHYERCLERWYAEFSKDNIHFVWQDVLHRSPDTYARQVCEALGISFRPVPDALKARSNEAAVPSSYYLAATGTMVKNWFRELGLYGVLSFAKRAGLKRVFYGKPGSAQGIGPTAEERVWLEVELANVIPAEALSGRDAGPRLNCLDL